MANTTQTPWIVLDRTAAVSGVTTVDGKSGAVELDDTDALKMGAALSVNGQVPDENGNINLQTGDEAPVLYLGEVMHVSTTSIPAGSLAADGKQYLRSQFPDLITAFTDGTLTPISDTEWRAGAFDMFSWGTIDGTDTGADGDATTGDYFRLPDVTNRIQNLQLSKLINDDLNTMFADASGWYYQNIEADATIANHYPVEGLCGTLVVYGNGTGAADGQAQGCTQVYYSANSDDVYTRYYTAAVSASDMLTATGGSWSDWKLMGSEISVDGEIDISATTKVVITTPDLSTSGSFTAVGNMATHGQLYVDQSATVGSETVPSRVAAYGDSAPFKSIGISGSPNYVLGADSTSGTVTNKWAIGNTDTSGDCIMNCYPGANYMGLRADGDIALAPASGRTVYSNGNISVAPTPQSWNTWMSAGTVSTGALCGYANSQNSMWHPQVGQIIDTIHSRARWGIGVVSASSTSTPDCFAIGLGTGSVNKNIVVYLQASGTIPQWTTSFPGTVCANGGTTPLTSMQEVHDFYLARIESLEARLALLEGTKL